MCPSQGTRCTGKDGYDDVFVMAWRNVMRGLSKSGMLFEREVVHFVLLVLVLLATVASIVALTDTWESIICVVLNSVASIFLTFFLLRIYSTVGKSHKHSSVQDGTYTINIGDTPWHPPVKADVKQKEEENCKEEVLLFAARIMVSSASQLQELDNVSAGMSTRVSSVLHEVLQKMSGTYLEGAQPLDTNALQSSMRFLLGGSDASVEISRRTSQCWTSACGTSACGTSLNTPCETELSPPRPDVSVRRSSFMSDGSAVWKRSMLRDRANMAYDDNFAGDGTANNDYLDKQLSLSSQLLTSGSFEFMSSDDYKWPMITSMTNILRGAMHDTSLLGFLFDGMEQTGGCAFGSTMSNGQTFSGGLSTSNGGLSTFSPLPTAPAWGKAKREAEEAAWGRYYLRQKKKKQQQNKRLTRGKKYGEYIKNQRRNNPLMSLRSNSSMVLDTPTHPRRGSSESSPPKDKSLFMSNSGRAKASARTSGSLFPSSTALLSTSSVIPKQVEEPIPARQTLYKRSRAKSVVTFAWASAPLGATATDEEVKPRLQRQRSNSFSAAEFQRLGETEALPADSFEALNAMMKQMAVRSQNDLRLAHHKLPLLMDDQGIATPGLVMPVSPIAE